MTSGKTIKPARKRAAAAVTSRRESAKAERRLRIISAARDLIRETGDTRLSMRTIAKRAKVSLATPYNLFGSKRAVVLAILEDVRDFSERFANLHPANSIERIFQALTLATDYYADDPVFYRTLWKALLDTNGKDTEHALFTPEGRAENHRNWRVLLQEAQEEDMLASQIDVDVLEKDLSYTFNGVMLNWVLGEIKTAEMLPSIGYGYSLALNGAATKKGARILTKKILLYQKMLSRTRRRASAA